MQGYQLPGMLSDSDSYALDFDSELPDRARFLGETRSTRVVGGLLLHVERSEVDSARCAAGGRYSALDFQCARWELGAGVGGMLGQHPGVHSPLGRPSSCSPCGTLGATVAGAGVRRRLGARGCRGDVFVHVHHAGMTPAGGEEGGLGTRPPAPLAPPLLCSPLWPPLCSPWLTPPSPPSPVLPRNEKTPVAFRNSDSNPACVRT